MEGGTVIPEVREKREFCDFEVCGKVNESRAKRIRRFISDRESMFSRTGSICKRYVRCGKPNCRCATGQRHGPYYELRWRDGDGKAQRFYLGGPEEAGAARQMLLKIRRKACHGYDHPWLYRRSIDRGLVLSGAAIRFMFDPTSKNFARIAALNEELNQIEAGQLHRTTKRNRRQRDSEPQTKVQTEETEDDEFTRAALTIHARRLLHETLSRLFGG